MSMALHGRLVETDLLAQDVVAPAAPAAPRLGGEASEGPLPRSQPVAEAVRAPSLALVPVTQALPPRQSVVEDVPAAWGIDLLLKVRTLTQHYRWVLIILVFLIALGLPKLAAVLVVRSGKRVGKAVVFSAHELASTAADEINAAVDEFVEDIVDFNYTKTYVANPGVQGSATRLPNWMVMLLGAYFGRHFQ